MIWARRRLCAILSAGLLAIGSGCAPNLMQRLQLVAAWPSNGESLPVGRHTLELTFNAPLDPRASWASVFGADTEMKIDDADPRHLTVRLTAPSPGSYQLRWHAVAMDAQDVTDGQQSFELRDESPMPARLNSGQTGATDVDMPLDLAGQGFARNASVTLTMGDDVQELATIETDARGSFKAQPKVLATIPFGVQPLTATDSQGHTASTAVEVRWGGWPPAVPIDVGAPGPGPDQVTFTVHLRNRSDYVLEHITLVLKDPPGAELIGTDASARREDHAMVWDIPTLPRGLAGPFNATYTASGAVASQAWMEFRHRPARGCTHNCPPAFISNSAAESLPVAPL